MDTEDQRDDELSTLYAIYPEIQRLDEGDPFTFTIDLPVNPTKAVTVFFPAAVVGHALNPAAPQPTAPANAPVDSQEIAHLPALRLKISLPPSYPSEKPPAVSISTTPSWLPLTTAKALEDECARLWEELGRDLIVFSYIDHVQQSADDVFGLVSNTGSLEIRPEHKIAVLGYDIEAKRRVFNNETFFCGVCLDPKKGEKCHRMLDCGHVFCTGCLQDFYSNAIREGDLTTVRCLEPGCAKSREAAQATGSKKLRKPKTHLSPSELLQLGLDQEMVRRYVDLKYKTELESDKNVVYCPRECCQGPARSKNHKKPKGFELQEAADSEPEDEAPTTGPSDVVEDRLAVCDDCGFAFCARCGKSWHGEYVICRPRRTSAVISAEEQASLDFITFHTSPCPQCSAPAQKTSGCNHMICYRCDTHFCYLCSSWLNPSDPYQHFNESAKGRRTGCYMRLWELEEGDEGGLNIFAGGRGQAINDQQAGEAQARALDYEREAHRLAGGEAQGGGNNRNERERPGLIGEVAVTQEGPLVLRLDVVVPPAGERRERPAEPAPRQQAAPGRRWFRGDARQQRPQAQPGQGAQQAARRPNPQVHAARPANRERADINEQVADIAGQHDQLAGADAAWIRHFVQLALEDQEDLLDEDG